VITIPANAGAATIHAPAMTANRAIREPIGIFDPLKFDSILCFPPM
jgi:hypothetical protein